MFIERCFVYPDLNLEPLLGDGQYAVHCSTIEEAQHFVNQIKKQYPANARNWHYGETRWYQADDICYSPHLNDNHLLTYAARAYYEKYNYTIFEFDDLLTGGNIDESELSLDFLFGGTV